MLAAGQSETALDEFARIQIELAGNHRVLATIREMNHAARLIGPQDSRSFKYPALAFGFVQGVHVQNGRPVWFSRRVVGERGFAPDSA